MGSASTTPYRKCFLGNSEREDGRAVELIRQSLGSTNLGVYDVGVGENDGERFRDNSRARNTAVHPSAFSAGCRRRCQAAGHARRERSSCCGFEQVFERETHVRNDFNGVFPAPVPMIIWPAGWMASSTPYWISGLSTSDNISFGWALVAGRKRVPRPAAGKTALRILANMLSIILTG